MHRLLLIICLCAGLDAQITPIIMTESSGSPVISGITCSDLDTHHFRVVGNLNANYNVIMYYGTATGGPYPDNSYVIQTGNGTDNDEFAFVAGGLLPSTEYFGIIKAGTVNGTYTATSSEFHCTTTAQGSIYPAAPTVYAPSLPTTTSGYTTVTLAKVGNVFEAASTVTHTGGGFCVSDPSWTVTAGDTLQTIFNEVKPGALIEAPQSTSGNVDVATGYTFPPYIDVCASSINDPNYRWVWLRTHQVNTADFPPYGFRTSPAWTKNATLVAQTPQALYGNGQFFTLELASTSATPINHVWISNLTLAVAPGSNTWGAYIAMSNTEGNPPDAATPLSYVVLDRLNFITPSIPGYAALGIYGGVGAYVRYSGLYMVGFQQAGNQLGVGIQVADYSLGPLTIDNVEVDAAGQEIYLETNDGQTTTAGAVTQPIENFVLTHTALYEPPNWLNPVNAGYGMWDGVARGELRNPFETKYGIKGKITGLWTDGSFAGQNAGYAIVFTGNSNANQLTGSTGTNDWEVGGNLTVHAASFLYAEGGGTGLDDCCNAPGAMANGFERLYVHDNVVLPFGAYLYSQMNRAGLDSGHFLLYDVQQATITNNTMFLDNGQCCNNGLYYTPEIVSLGNGGPPSGALKFTSNLAFLSQGPNGSPSDGVLGPNTPYQNSPCSSGGCQTSTPLATQTTPLTILGSVTGVAASNYTWNNNTIICGTAGYGGYPWTDITATNCSTYAGQMPSGDQYPTSNTLAGRITQAGLTNYANNDPTLTPTTYNYSGAVGANLTYTEQELGVVNNISVTSTLSSITVAYTAPDTNSCSVDTSPDGTTWTRQTDAGGAESRSLTFTGLTPRIAYQYRLMCYFAQANAIGPDRPWFGSGVPWDHSNQQTEGSIVTTTSKSIGAAAVGGIGIN